MANIALITNNILTDSGTPLTSIPSGTGTTNYLSKWTSSSTLNNSLLYDDGTNVGIGTTSPAYKLDVNGTFRVQGNSSIIATSSGVSSSANAYIYDSTTNYLVFTKRGSSEIGNMGLPAGSVEIGNYNNGALGIWTSSNYIALGSNSSEKMRLNISTGNLLIGTTTDAGYKLDVNGTARVQGQLEVLSTSSAQGLLLKHTALSTTATQIYYNSSDAVTYLDTLFSYTASQPFGSVNIRTKDSLNALTSRLYVEGNSGNVGIGTTTFLGKFQVGSGSATQFQVASSGASIYVGPSSGNYNMNITTNTIQSSNSGTTNTYLYIQPNGTGNVAMCSSGTNKVLIGTTTDAGFKLDVNGTSMFRGATQYTADIALNNNRLYIGSLSGNTVLRPVSTTNLQLYNNNTGATLFLNANGAVQIGQHTGSSWAYFTASSSILYNTVTLPSLAGTGTRMVVADATGILSTQAVPTGTVTGSGTTNYISKWTSSTALGNSLIYDNGTNVLIGTTTDVGYKLQVAGNTLVSGVTATSSLNVQNAADVNSNESSNNLLVYADITGGSNKLYGGGQVKANIYTSSVTTPTVINTGTTVSLMEWYPTTTQGVMIDYVFYIASGNYMRSGTFTAVNDNAGNTQYVDNATPDLNGSTSTVTFAAVDNGGTIEFQVTNASGSPVYMNILTRYIPTIF